MLSTTAQLNVGCVSDSPYRDLLSQAILKLKEDQVIEKLREKWWKIEGITHKCPEITKEKNNAHALQLQNVAGIFYILIGGTVLAFVAAGFEYCRHSKKSQKMVPYINIQTFIIS